MKYLINTNIQLFQTKSRKEEGQKSEKQAKINSKVDDNIYTNK